MNRFSAAATCLPWKLVNLFVLTLLLSYLSKVSSASDLPNRSVEVGGNLTTDMIA